MRVYQMKSWYREAEDATEWCQLPSERRSWWKKENKKEKRQKSKADAAKERKTEFAKCIKDAQDADE